ncbi:NAD(P)-dependent oxidoreductase [Halorarum halophilum]|uniref:NAD(P)-dependent oxidoreductase n=1 Tax=Halorarum halophilum TaxID=2743090 RepID=UPI001C4F8641|nr:NAD(P)-dependent oxidoreductase [Halobaculum halophilum]
MTFSSLVNVARGSLVDGDVLLDALNAGKIAGWPYRSSRRPTTFDHLFRDYE